MIRRRAAVPAATVASLAVVTYPPGPLAPPPGPQGPYPAPGYPGPGYAGLPAPYPGAAPRPPRPPRSTKGATALVVVGAVVMVLALVAGVLGATTFVRALPTGVVDATGRPGSDALASGDVPGEAEVDLVGGQPYTVWAVRPAGDDGFSVADVTVTCPDGELGVGWPGVTGNAGLGAYEATTVAEVSAATSQRCTVAVAAGSSDPGTTFVVTEGWRFGEFFTTIGGTILLWFVAVGGGLLGVGLLIGGIVWRVLARRP